MIHSIHRYLKLHSIFSRFFFWIVVFVTLTSLLYLITYVIVDKNNRINKAEEELTYSLSNQRLIVDNWIRERREEVRLLTSFSVTKAADIDIMATRFQYYHDFYSQINSIVFIDKDGYVNIDTAHPDVILKDKKIHLAERSYFAEAERGKEAVSDYRAPSLGQERVLIFSSPVKNEDNIFNGVVFSAVYLTKVNDLLRKALQYDSGSTTLINSNGVVVSRVTKENGSAIISENLSEEELNQITSEKTGLYEYTNENNEEILRAFTSIVGGKYILINEIDKREVLAPHYQMVKMMLGITCAIIVVALVLVIPVSRRILRPFYLLLWGLERMRDGSYKTRLEAADFYDSPTELQKMMAGFNEMAEAISENKRNLQQISLTDELTKIANRRLFEQRLSEEWEQTVKNNETISLIFFDIDYFKQFNDLFGHQAGDRCLIAIAQTVDHAMEKLGYLVARYGGEEFVIILPNADSKTAVRVANIVRERVKALRIKRTLSEDSRNVKGRHEVYDTHDKLDGHDAYDKHGAYNKEIVTASVGVATIVPKPHEQKEILIQLADQAVYEAKSLGRDRVVVKER